MIGKEVLHYRIVRQLGSGGMGVVYEAVDTRLGRHVAIKLLNERVGAADDAADRFEREARIASSLNHPNICTIHDIGVLDDEPGAGGTRMRRRFIVMELLEGESLKEKIRGQPLPNDVIFDVGCQIADALDAAHDRGIVHRDVKPANILITKRGQAKLLDFGVAKLDQDVHEAADETRVAADVLTTPGMAVGSINYMSPEQARGEALDGRTDLFSLGLVLYEMATGRQAFSGQTTAVVFDAILNRHPDDPALHNPSLPDDLRRVIMRALEKDRRMRFQTAADMLSELGRIRRDSTSRTLAAPAATSAASTVHVPVAGAASGTSSAAAASTRRWPLLAAGLVLIAGLAIGLYYWSGAGGGTPVLTERDTLVVADFTNTTGDPVFDDALKQAVAVQLQQTPFVSLLPDAAVQRTLALMQKPADEPVRGATVRELCQRAGAKATVEGSIAPLGTSYVLAIGVHNCETGASLAQQQVQAASKEEVLAVLGGAVTELRKGLGESLASIEKYDTPVLEATTSSLEALKVYGLANRTRYTRGDEAAIPLFEQAIQIDPNFALAYAKLGVMQANIGRSEDAAKNAAKAYEFKDRVSEYERLYIVWNHASRVLRDQDLAFRTLEVMTSAYPRDFAARNNLGTYYLGRRDYPKALEQFVRASEIAPEEPTPLANAAHTLFFLDRRDEAYAWAERALKVRPDGGLAVTRWFAAVRGNDPQAEAFAQAAEQMATPGQLHAARSSIALWRGHLVEYRRLVDQQRAEALAKGDLATAASLNLGEAVTRALYEHDARASGLAALIKDPKLPPPLRAQGALVSAMVGDLASAKAALPALEKEGRQNQATWVPTVIARAHVDAAEGNAQKAIDAIQALLAEFPQGVELNFHLGRIRESAGDRTGAIEAYRATVAALPILGLAPVVPGCRLALAEALIANGDRAAANEQLDILLEQWKNADTEFALLKQVRSLRGS